MLADSTVQDFRKLKDGSGQYLWQPGMAAGVPDMLFGKRVVTDNDVQALGTGNESVIFGDLRRAYMVRVVGGMDVARSDDFAFDTDLVTWRFVARADGALVDENAVVIGSNA
jgi:HK97 family phage major capsid protein